MKKNYKEIIKKIITDKEETKEEINNDARVKLGGSIILAAISLVLTIMNVVKGYSTMSILTGSLVLGFALSAFLCGKFKLRKISMIMTGLLVTALFSYFAISGQNEGFAILWILILPPLSTTTLNIKLGSAVILYFQILLFVIFYIPPIREKILENTTYTITFVNRFPVLYFAIAICSLFLNFEIKYYGIKTKEAAYLDQLTNISNRLHYNALKETKITDDNIEGITIIEADLNCLKITNDTKGHLAGDELLIATARCLQSAFQNAIVVARMGGDEFMIVTRVDSRTLHNQIFNLNRLVSSWKGEFSDSLSISIGYVTANSECKCSTISELEKEADKRMYEEKSKYYLSSGIERRKRN